MWARGCLLTSLLAAPLYADQIAVPSGQPVELSEVLVDTIGTQAWVRFRFLAPDVARSPGKISYAEAGPDMEALCAEVALPYLKKWAIQADKVVISLSDRTVPFGQADPDATQFFEAYRIEDGACIWEEF
ncbi:MAG: DUF6497 family protein [Pseudomonadota bacterium]